MLGLALGTAHSILESPPLRATCHAQVQTSGVDKKKISTESMPVVYPRLVVHMLLAAFCPPATGSEEELEGAMAMAMSMSQIICTRPASILRSTAAPNPETNSTKKIETESKAKAGGPHEDASILPVVQVCSSPRFAASGKNWSRVRGRGGKAEIERAWENVAAACVVGVSLVFVGNVGTADAVEMAAGRFVSFPWEQAKAQAQTQEEPQRGTCATCIGVVDDTLGACSATTNCVSSFDDRSSSCLWIVHSPNVFL